MLIQRKKRQYQQKVAADVKRMNDHDPQSYWQFWKRHRSSAINTDLLDPSAFTTYYKNIETKPVNEFFDMQFMANIEDLISQYREGDILNTNDILDDILNAPINLDETVASMKRIKSNKAAGTDGIPVEFYKNVGDILSRH